MESYDPKQIEKKWQKKWEEDKLYKAKDDFSLPKYYCLIEFPYPSGEGMHVGHIRSNTAMDIIARKRRAEGFNVLYPIGWDAFGLPTENYAIKTSTQPKIVTKNNTDNFRRQLKAIGFSFDWSREIDTTDPAYYKWTQWIFLQLFKKGLAYKKKTLINWCPSCKIGLANEEVVDGNCERCGGVTEKREKEQWMLAITKYADRLDKDLDKVNFLEKIKIQQRNWIGRSEGAIIKFKVESSKLKDEDRESPRGRSVLEEESEPVEDGGKRSDLKERALEVFTTRVDTIFGCTYVVVAPEHNLIESLKSKIENYEEVEKYTENAKKQSEVERTSEDKEKTGVEIRGVKAINPFNGEEVPIFVADYVLGHYGTGAVMAVPAHDERDFEFAKKYDLKITTSIQGDNSKLETEKAFTEDGALVNSGEFTGLKSADAREKMTEWLEKNGMGGKKINYKLRDWVFSRQRYWGEPIPLVFCESCKGKVEKGDMEGLSEGEILNPGWFAVDEKDLPLELPEVENYKPTDTGESPLANIKDWVKTKCPKCGGEAIRETDTMPNWAGSSWYFLRYVDSQNDQILADKDKLKYWTPVDWYNGGMEHTTLHLLYSRFWHKFLYDIGVVPTDEPYAKRTAHGMILAEGGVKMSKSKGNTINPDEIVEKYGADTLRVYEMFMGPFDQSIAWSMNNVNGARRFLDRFWNLSLKVLEVANVEPSPVREGSTLAGTHALDKNMVVLYDTELHRTIKKVTEDIEEMKFNTAISQMMVLMNKMEESEYVARDDFAVLVRLLAPFAPHITEELWENMGFSTAVHLEKWPQYDPSKLMESTFELVVQINGKIRDRIEVPTDVTEKEAKELTLKRENVRKHLGDKTEPRKTIFVPGKLINFVI